MPRTTLTFDQMAVIIVLSDMEQEAKVRSCTGLNRLNQRVHGFNPSKISDINWSTYVCPHIARKNAESAPPKAYHRRRLTTKRARLEQQ